MRAPTIGFSGMARDFKPVRSMMTISGDSEVRIENCKRLIECGDIKCGLISAGYLIEVWGSGLSASSFADGSACITGRVQSISISRRRGREDDGR
ncbi:YabP family protein [Ruminococcus sp. YE71]|uniref:YabP/YqfC family sporulation protein n=1 Tax=unclassified Ruminococcus TaxID=2608920 RepID=UPI000880F7BA|nr:MULTISPECIES: YabP/YqfC family sporulation protein [unclassified Ruminococcus]SDA18791.1 YabP family protein [Ruminococcus sp. YE78]SFW29316.1 YabP family protein [Ruminococcus sp. YE71]